MNNKRELQNIGINHSADIDYKGFIRIYIVCTKKPFNYLTIDTTKDNKSIKNFDDDFIKYDYQRSVKNSL